MPDAAPWRLQEYLGDSVYAVSDGWDGRITLRLNSHTNCASQIVLEPEVFERLKAFGAKVIEERAALARSAREEG